MSDVETRAAARSFANAEPAEGGNARQSLTATGGVLGAIVASSCCILPLVLFSLGIGGAWMANLTALAPYKPYVLTVTAGLLGYGFYLAYWKPNRTCHESGACARPARNRAVKVALWTAALLAFAAFGFDYAAPVLLGI